MNYEHLKTPTLILAFKMCINIHNHHQKSVTAFAAFLGGKNIICLANIKIHAKLTRLLQSAPIMDF